MRNILTFSALAALSSQAAAVEQKETVTKESQEIEVMVVIGSKLDSPQQNLEVPRALTIITDKHLQNTMAQELSDVLRQTPSIATTDNSRPLAGQISIRGFGNERINLNVDGVNYQQYSDGSNKNSYFNPLDIDPSIVKAIEVTRGADGIAQGSGAIGGQIQVVTKGGWDYTGDKAGAGAVLRAGYGDAPDLRQYGSSAFYATDDYAVALHANRRSFGEIKLNLPDKEGELRGQSQRVKNDSQSDDLRLKVNVKTASGQLVSDTQHTKSEIADLPFRNADSWADQPLTETEQSKRFSQALGYRYQGKAAWQNLQSRVYYQRFERERLQQGSIILAPNTFPFHSLDTFKDQSFGGSLQQQMQYQAGSFYSVLTSFAQADKNRFDDRMQDFLTNSNGTYYGKSQGTNLAAGMRADLDWSTWLSSEMGLRYDHYRRSSDNFAQYGKNSDADWSSNLGVTIRPTEWLRLYSRYNESFRGPNLRELYKLDEWRCHRPTKICYSEPQPDLKAENSRNTEVGMGLTFNSLPYADQLMLKLNWFDTRVDNFIDTAPYMYKLVAGEKVFASPTEATHRDYSSKNISELRSLGIEFELTYRLGALEAFANYSQVRMDVSGVPNFFLGTIEQRRQPYERAPQDVINLGIHWQFATGLSLSTVSRFTKDMQRLPQLYLDRNMDGKGSQLHNVYLAYQPEFAALQGLIVRAGIENITDKTYAIWPDPESKTMPGRNYKVNLSYQF